MPNWTAITETTIRAGKMSDALDRVKEVASDRGEADPVPEFIIEIVAQIRAAVRLGNTLDVDPEKVPIALKGLASRMILYRIYSYLEVALEEDDRNQAREDNSYLKRIIDSKIKFDAPDDPDTARGPFNPGQWNSQQKLIGRTFPIPSPGRQFPPGDGYANPDAPSDSEA